MTLKVGFISGGERAHMRRTTVLGLGILVVGLVGACSADASTRAGGTSDPSSTTTVAPVAAPDPGDIPAGTTLRIGDQLEYLQTILRLAGEDDDFPYRVKYSAFVGGPPMLQAFQGGALDVGFVGSTPLIFAQAQGQEITAVAGWASEKGSYGLVTAPGVKGIGGWGDLAGKRVAYQRGTAAEAALLQALDAAGVDPHDVTTVDIPINQATAALTGGSADAAVTVEPLTSVYLASNPAAKVVDHASEITDRSSFFIASRATLDDDAKSAALADYTTRLVRAFGYLRSHPDQVAQAIYVDQYHLTPERAAQVVDEQGVGSFVELPGEVEHQQQALADLFVAAGQIPKHVDVAAEFDTRFNDLVQKAQDQ
jgi:sulfonate transport system substrate-binding protein